MHAASKRRVNLREKRSVRIFSGGVVCLAGALSLASTAWTIACSAPAASSSDPSIAANLISTQTGLAASPEPVQKARIAETSKESLADVEHGRCPRNMVEIPSSQGRGDERAFCIDRWEASLVEMMPSGDERPFSPFEGVDGKSVRAVSMPDVFPQGYISEVQAQRACFASGKRLCRVNEWRKACRGPDKQAYGYATRRQPGRCNDRGRNPVLALYGRGHWNWSTMNQPELNQLDGTLAKTGSHPGCTNGYGVFDMVGNLHEWVADPQGTFFGGYYQDVASVGHGEGCGYETTAHEARYHDYSTGFRCCAEPR